MRHASRVVFLLDSAVLLGGAAKGRSSSRLKTILRSAAALQLFGDLLVYWVLVPSAENPSDIPSRGRLELAGYWRRRHGLTTKGSVPVFLK